ncbi:MAG: SEC-C domain-containing protein [Ktedonobacterales bacterium]
MAAIERRVGVTPAERYLQQLCDHSFLSLWSYAGVHRDQGRVGGKGDGRELCDLLVVFGDHILLFSDKYCEYPNTENAETNWKRWYKKAVRKSADQLWGAESHILAHPNTLYLDPACSQPFPIPLPDKTRARVHRIAVAHGAAQQCRAHFGSASASLTIDTSVVGDADLFTIGQVDTDRGYVHVFDDETLDIIMDALDSITDFVQYLTRKECLLTSGRRILVPGEENLLAFYLQNVNEQGEHDFVLPNGKQFNDYDSISLPEGLWEDFCADPQRMAQIAANEVSYAWDALIEVFGKHAWAGTQYYTTKPGIEHSERILRFLAQETRFRRRLLARALIEVIEQTPIPKTGFAKLSRIIPPLTNDLYYVFLAMSRPSIASHEDYREFRREYLSAHCLVTKLLYPNAQDIVGIATEPGGHQDDQSSEDALYFDGRLWDDDMRVEAERLQREVGILTNVSESHRIERDYPLLQQPDTSYVTAQLPPRKPKIRQMPLTNRQRNMQCPCGSGRKYKHCHGT